MSSGQGGSLDPRPSQSEIYSNSTKKRKASTPRRIDELRSPAPRTLPPPHPLSFDLQKYFDSVWDVTIPSLHDPTSAKDYFRVYSSGLLIQHPDSTCTDPTDEQKHEAKPAEPGNSATALDGTRANTGDSDRDNNPFISGITTGGNEGIIPVYVLIHGAGAGALSWAMLAKELQQCVSESRASANASASTSTSTGTSQHTPSEVSSSTMMASTDPRRRYLQDSTHAPRADAPFTTDAAGINVTDASGFLLGATTMHPSAMGFATSASNRVVRPASSIGASIIHGVACLAIDLRAHGASRSALERGDLTDFMRQRLEEVVSRPKEASDEIDIITRDEQSLSIQQFCNDILEALLALFRNVCAEQLSRMRLILVGHSVGGAVAVQLAHDIMSKSARLPTMAGIITIDSATYDEQALQMSAQYLLSFPEEFESLEAAKAFVVESGMVHNIESVKISTDHMFFATGVGNRVRWRTALAWSLHHWIAWYKDFASKLMELPSRKLLIMSDPERLDWELHVQHMNGKLQVAHIKASHFVHEDEPESTARIILAFTNRILHI